MRTRVMTAELQVEGRKKVSQIYIVVKDDVN